MPKTRRSLMCSNTECEQFDIETSLLGGCGSCGQALVRYRPSYTPPNDEQLERFIYALVRAQAARVGLGGERACMMATAMIIEDPVSKAKWRERHRELQESAWERI